MLWNNKCRICGFVHETKKQMYKCEAQGIFKFRFKKEEKLILKVHGDNSSMRLFRVRSRGISLLTHYPQYSLQELGKCDKHGKIIEEESKLEKIFLLISFYTEPELEKKLVGIIA